MINICSFSESDYVRCLKQPRVNRNQKLMKSTVFLIISILVQTSLAVEFELKASELSRWLDLKCQTTPNGLIECRNTPIKEQPIIEQLIKNDITTSAKGDPIIGQYTIQNPLTSNAKTGPTKWYRQINNKQIFTLSFDDRPSWGSSKSARSEAAGKMTWTNRDGPHTFQAEYDLRQMNGSFIIAQVMNIDKSSSDVYEPQVLLRYYSDIKLLRELKTKNSLNLLKPQFKVKIVDDGISYQVYIDGRMFASGRHARQTGQNIFKWGLYSARPGSKATITITGAQQLIKK